MKSAQAFLLSFVLWAATGAACGADARTVQSQSGQFVVRGLPLELPPIPNPMWTNASFVRLDPAVFIVSCERIKQALLELLGLRDQWRGRIYIALRPIQQDREPIFVTVTGFADGWAYRIEMPEQVDRARLLKMIVQVLLLEIGNRRAQGKSVELPPWLADGLAAHLDGTAAVTLALEPETRVTRHESNLDPLRTARQVLRARPPLTLNELNWPADEQFSDENIDVYRSCAHLFVHELLRLRNGRESLDEMLRVLPEYLNWQTAFLGSFRQHFSKLAEVDKWWALQAVQFTGRDMFSVWSPAETLRQLDLILSTTVQVRLQTSDLPAPTQARLQSIIAEWTFDRQFPVLLQKIYQLQALQLRSAKEWAGLVGDYLSVLDHYLQTRDKPRNGGSPRSVLAANSRIAIQQALRRLDELDLKRLRLQQGPGGIETAVDSALAESFRRPPSLSVPVGIKPGRKP